MTQQQVNKLNGVSEEDLVKEKKKIERDILEDPFGKWRIQHWRKVLIGKEFEDEGTRWYITDVSLNLKAGLITTLVTYTMRIRWSRNVYLPAVVV